MIKNLLNVKIVGPCAPLSAMMLLFLSGSAFAAGINAVKVSEDLSKFPLGEAAWKEAREEVIPLMAQPMAVPRPKVTTTSSVRVQAIHDGKRIVFRLRWSDPNKNEGGKVGTYSDAAAIQFPTKEGPAPIVFMGGKDQPVHIIHWRAQYQIDREKGQPTIKDLYPNANVDMYPMEFKDSGNLKGLDEEAQEVYSHGRAAGNPQSYPKTKGADEMMAEGFGTSVLLPEPVAEAMGRWEKNEWTLQIVRPLSIKDRSTLKVGQQGFVAFAVWQGARDEVGARKSVTMSWVPITLTELP